MHRKYICFYYTNNRNPRLLVQPAKVEIANLKPRVWMLRNVLTETEMNRLKELAGPKVGVVNIGSLLRMLYIQWRKDYYVWPQVFISQQKDLIIL